MNKLNSQALIVVAKRPAPGRTKTRLSPPLTAAQTSAIYECFLLDTLDLIRQVPNVKPVIAFLPNSERNYFERLAPDFELIPQSGDDLGERLDNALTHYLEQGCKRVIVMNSDSPTLPARYLVQAFEYLTGEADVVIGPCEDGGYYLIGVKQPIPKLLREVRMSTSSVTQDTLTLAELEDLQVQLLPPWYDIDNAAALFKLENEITGLPRNAAVHAHRFLSQFGPFFQDTSV